MRSLSANSRGTRATAAAVTGLFAALAVAACWGATASAGTPAITPQQAEELGAEAYRYGLPLLEFMRVRKEQTSVACPDGQGSSPVNSFSNARHFPDPDDDTVVAPNTDTLYSIAHLDLSHGPIVLSHVVARPAAVVRHT